MKTRIISIEHFCPGIEPRSLSLHYTEPKMVHPTVHCCPFDTELLIIDRKRFCLTFSGNRHATQHCGRYQMPEIGMQIKFSFLLYLGGRTTHVNASRIKIAVGLQILEVSVHRVFEIWLKTALDCPEDGRRTIRNLDTSSSSLKVKTLALSLKQNGLGTPWEKNKCIFFLFIPYTDANVYKISFSLLPLHLMDKWTDIGLTNCHSRSG